MTSPCPLLLSARVPMRVDAEALIAVPCPLCAAPASERERRARILLNEVELGLAYCAADDVFWLTPRPGDAFYDEMYGELFYASPIPEQFGYATREIDDSRRTTKATQNWDDIDKHGTVVRRERVLEIGCATGEFLVEASRRGFARLAGVELDPTCCEVARSRGIEVFRGRFEDLAAGDGAWPLIFADNVIEHVFSPRVVVEKCAALQAEGDLLIFRLPDTPPEGPRLKLVDHTVHFTRRSIAGLLSACGYRVETIFFSGRYLGVNEPGRVDNRIDNMTVIAHRAMKTACPT